MRFFKFTLIVLLAVFLPALEVLAESQEEEPRIGLALSGGGARGGAHVGVLKALEEMNITVDYVAGTSMGAIIGGLYASGYTAAEIERLLQQTDWNKALTDKPQRRNRTMRKKSLERDILIPYRVGFNQGRLQLPLGAIEGQHLDQVFHRMLVPVVGIDDFDDLPIPFRAVATDLVSGEAVVLSGGSLANALRASMSVPGIFAPVEIDGRLLVDGGMANNLPIDIVRQMGADVVIAVDISTPLLTEEQLTSVLAVTEQLTGFLTRRTTEAQIATLGNTDVLLVPELGDFSSSNFEGADDIVPLGYDSAMAAKAQLARLGSSDVRESQPVYSQSNLDYIVQFIEIDNATVLDDELIRSRLDVEPGLPLDIDALENSLDKIYSLDVFKSVTYDLVENEAGESGIVVRARPRSWGPNYLQLGLELSSDFSESSDFQLSAAYTRNALNSLGGEFRLLGSIGRRDQISFNYYQPIDHQARWYIEPEVFWRRQNFNLWLDDVNIAEIQLQGWGGSFGLGRNLSTTDRLSLTYGYVRGNAKIITGNPGFPLDDSFRIGELNLEYLHDSFDSLWFPTSGMLHHLGYRYASESLGASTDYQQASVDGAFAFTRGRNTFLLGYELGYSFDDKAPFERWYRMGGLGRLSGLAPDQLSGRHAGLANLIYFRRINNLDLFPAYLGATLEAGNVWNVRDDIALDDLRYSASLFVGADSPIGPVYFAVGRSDSGDNAVYFYVGDPFTAHRFD